jgi:aspartate/methionine/tyrosine aminotransferase
MIEPARDLPKRSSGLRAAIEALPASRIREVANAGIGRKDVIPLWFGEPDVPTPSFICDAAADALAAGDTFYQPNAGILALREALADYMNRLYGTALTPGNVIVSASAMNALMLVMQALVDPGDVVVTTTPAWPNLPAVPRILSGAIRPVPLTPGNAGWRLDLDRLLDACDARTKVIFLNSPNNPTGWMMTSEQQREVLAFARPRGIWIVSDEVYARIVYDRPVAPSFLEFAEPEDRVIVVNSFSKSWAMTGWRLGWITAPKGLLETFEKLTEFNIAGPPGFVQRAGVVAARDGEQFVEQTVARFGRARDLRRRAALGHAPDGSAAARCRLLCILRGRRHERYGRLRRAAGPGGGRRPGTGRGVRTRRRGSPSPVLRRLAAHPRARLRPARDLPKRGLAPGQSIDDSPLRRHPAGRSARRRAPAPWPPRSRDRAAARR